MHFVYILKCSNDTYYTGLTNNIEHRVQEHQSGLVKSTHYRVPAQLVWFCGFPDRTKAAALEKYLKQQSGRAFLKKRLI